MQDALSVAQPTVSDTKNENWQKVREADREIGGSRQSRCTRRLQNSQATNRPPWRPHAIQHWSPDA